MQVQSRIADGGGGNSTVSAQPQARPMSERCQHCDAPDAIYERRDNPHGRYCEACATRIGHEENGEAYAGVKLLGVAVQFLRDVGVSDEKIVGTLHEILTAPHSDGHFPIGGDTVAVASQRTAEQPWRRIFRELPGGES